LRKIRERKKITQFDLASIIDKDRQSIQRVEAGNINPTIFYLYELSEGLQIPLKEITNFNFPKEKQL
jgi:transcriptional regulator with XRE-family HTH domain